MKTILMISTAILLFASQANASDVVCQYSNSVYKCGNTVNEPKLTPSTKAETPPDTHPPDNDPPYGKDCDKPDKHRDGKHHKDGKHKDGKHKDGKHKDGKHKGKNGGKHKGDRY